MFWPAEDELCCVRLLGTKRGERENSNRRHTKAKAKTRSMSCSWSVLASCYIAGSPYRYRKYNSEYIQRSWPATGQSAAPPAPAPAALVTNTPGTAAEAALSEPQGN